MFPVGKFLKYLSTIVRMILRKRVPSCMQYTGRVNIENLIYNGNFVDSYAYLVGWVSDTATGTIQDMYESDENSSRLFAGTSSSEESSVSASLPSDGR
ncbi:hypothetical protein TNCV_4184541 [Trichonephila clavipes]|nr:hypothetical protein TNCV_4184541 [Trichonephila clavipes]